MFKTGGNHATVNIIVDGETVQVPEGVSVASALLLLGSVPVRHSKVDQSPRAPYCLMGVCAECLVTINDEPGQFACQTTVQQEMRVERSLHKNTSQVKSGNAD